ncbi:carboxypeptidase s, partial [Rhizoctonia solani]
MLSEILSLSSYPVLESQMARLATTLLLAAELAFGLPTAWPVFSRAPKAYDIQGHRGSRGATVESTLPAFAWGLIYGVKTLEFDNGITKDGHVLVWHDESIDGTKCKDTKPVTKDDPLFPYVGKYVANLTLAQIKTLDCGSERLDGFPLQALYPGTKLSTLPELFDFLDCADPGHEVELNIESKVDAQFPNLTRSPEDFANAQYKLFKSSKYYGKITYQSFDWRTLVLMKKLDPKITRAALIDSTTVYGVNNSTSTWLAGLRPDSFSGATLGVQIAQAAKSIDSNILSPAATDGSSGSLDPNIPSYKSFTTEDMVKEAHKSGMLVKPWTVNRLNIAEQIYGWGVDGIITDYPEVVRRWALLKGVSVSKTYDQNKVLKCLKKHIQTLPRVLDKLSFISINALHVIQLAWVINSKLRDRTTTPNRMYAGSTKQSEPPLSSVDEQSSHKRRSHTTMIGVLFVTLVALYQFAGSLSGYLYDVSGSRGTHDASLSGVCLQVEPLAPTSNINRKLAENLEITLSDPSFEAVAAEYLGGAVRIPTESYDVMDPVGIDPRWEVFYKFSEHLLKTYPKVHATMTQTRINTHGLLYHWPGSDSSLKPILLTAHQDVVPVDPSTVDSWIHPPYSGHYDGTWVWGRGSVDDKSGLVGIMITLEKLIESGFKPKRGILVGFGIDEESTGLYVSTDENLDLIMSDSIEEIEGISVALPAIGEKGYLDVSIEVATPGGHSSVPPAHTTIGILASLITKIESTPYVPSLARSSPVYGLLQCFAAHVPSIPSSVRSSIFRSICPPEASPDQLRKCDEALQELEHILFEANSDLNQGSEEKARVYRSLLGTTQATDMIQGGVKANALPELASAIVNHRIRTDSSVLALQDDITAKLIPLVKEYNLTLTAFSHVNVTIGGGGNVKLSDAFNTALEPAPVSPIEGPGAAAYHLLSGVIRKTQGHKTIVSPALMGGNTDTQFYWNLTSNIFRYSHLSEGDIYAGIHTINEALRVKGFVKMIRFFKNLILTADDAINI